jgi:hypothetical protein
MISDVSAGSSIAPQRACHRSSNSVVTDFDRHMLTPCYRAGCPVYSEVMTAVRSASHEPLTPEAIRRRRADKALTSCAPRIKPSFASGIASRHRHRRSRRKHGQHPLHLRCGAGSPVHRQCFGEPAVWLPLPTTTSSSIPCFLLTAQSAH